MLHFDVSLPDQTGLRTGTWEGLWCRLLRFCVGVAGLMCWMACAAWGGSPELAQETAGNTTAFPGVRRLDLTPVEQAWLREHPVIRVALDPDWPPVEFMDRNGRMCGLTIDYLALISEMTGIRFDRVEGLAWPEAYERLKRWDIDITLCFSETDERRERLAFTKPYLNSPIVVMTRDDVSYVGALSELNGRRVAVVKGYAPSEWLARDHPEIEQVKVASVGEAFEKLRHDEVFAVIDNMLVLNYYLTTTRVKGLRITGMTPYVYAQAIAVRKDWVPLVGILQKAIDAIPAETRETLYKKWVPVRFGTPFNYTLLGHALLVTVMLLFGLAAWSWRLSREVKARLSAEQRLAESESNYRHLFQDHRAAKLVVDAQTGAIVDANRAASAYYGWTYDDLVGMSIYEINTLPRDRVRQQMDIALRGGGGFEFQHRLADGALRDVEVLSSRVQWQGRTCLHSIVHDITERKLAMLDRDRLMAAINQVDEGIVITNADGVIQFVNPGFVAATGITREAVIGQSVNALKDGESGKALYHYFCEVVRNGNLWRGRFQGNRPDGSRRISEASIVPVRNENGSIVNFVSVERDVTEHVAVYEQLLHAQKMESVGRLAGGIAHDFNNLLQVILGHVELAEDELGSHHPVSADLRMIRESASRSKELTSQLLTFARRQPVVPAVVKLNDVVAGMIAMVKKLFREEIELVWQPDPATWSVKMDHGQMQQLVVNLCTNARDAIAGAGTVIIKTGNLVSTAGEPNAASLAGISPGEYAVLVISDTGCGLSDEIRSHLFEPFYTTKKEGRGTGLGLAAVYGIVKQNGGFIGVESEKGEGTTFTIYLPRYEQPVEQPATPLAPCDAMERGRGEWILVVDDDTALLEMVEKMLKKLGYQVCATHLPAHALTLVQKREQAFRLLLTDVVMPGMNGKELANLVRACMPEICVLLMSGYTSNVIEIQDELGAGMDFLQKPFNMLALARQVRLTLGK